MGTTQAQTKPSFKVGEKVRVWDTKGCRILKGGASSSERVGGDFPDIEPDEDLVVKERLGSTKAIVERTHEDCKGMQILMHLNHINPGAQYYALRRAGNGSSSATTTKKAPIADRVKAAKEELDRKMHELEEALQEQAQEEAELQARAAEEYGLSAEDEAEAEKLFAEG